MRWFGGTVEDMLNGLLEAEAEQLVGAGRYERNAERQDTRAGHYERSFDMKVGRVKLQMPKLRKLSFETSIIERYKRRESSVEEALIEMYLAGVSVRRVEDITEALWGTRVSPGTVSNLNKKIYEQIESWRNRRLEGSYPFIYLDGIWLKRSWGGAVENVSVLVGIGVNEEGYREIIGVVEGAKEDRESWKNFLRHLKDRGLKGAQLVISDKCLGLVESINEFYPEAKWQRCVVHYYRNVFSLVPKSKVKEVAARLVREGIEETLSYMSFPREYWRRIRTNNPMERIMREIRRRTRVVGCFPDGHSALMLVAARLRHIASSKWRSGVYLNIKRLYEESLREVA